MSRNFPGGARLLLALMASTMIIPAGVLTRPATAQEAAVTYDVAAGALGSAITRVAERSGLQVFYPADLVRGKQSPGVSGAMSPALALARVLAGSGLTFEYTAGGTVTITAVRDTGNAAAAADGAVVLDTVVIQAGGATTEGTGSYTSDSTSTSTRLPLSIRDTPQSISVVTNQQISDQSATSLTDVFAYTTGFVASEAQQQLSSRGFSTNSFLVDGLTSNFGPGWAGGHLGSPAMYDHVEAVRGATGFLNGSGSLGGAVNLVRKRADSSQPKARIETRAGTWNMLGFTFDGQTPLTQDGGLRGRLVYDRMSSDGFKDRYHTDRELIYGTLEYDLTPDTTLTFSAHRRTENPEGYEWSSAATIYTDGTPTRLPRGFSTAPSWNRMDTKETSVSAEIDHSFGNGWTATASIAEYRSSYDNEMAYTGQIRDRITGLGEGLPYPWAAKYNSRQISANAMASGPVEFLGRSHDLVFGASTQREWGRYRGASGSYTDYADEYNIPLWDWDGDLPRFPIGEYADTAWSRGASMVSAYGAGDFAITDQLKAIAGLRYSKWENGTRKFNETTPYLGLVYDINSDLSAYVGYTDIFSPQNAKDRNGDYLDPVIGKAYEAGLKAEMFEGRLNGSLSVFQNEQDNVAVTDDGQFVPGTTDQAYIGVKGAESKGVEIEVSGEILPGWNGFVGLAYADATNAQGQRLDSSIPRSSVKLFTTYRLTGAAERWTVGGGLRWQGRTLANITTSQGTYRVSQGSYTVADLMVRYDLSEQISAQLNVKNVFDKVYYENAGFAPSYGEPRNLALTLTSRF